MTSDVREYWMRELRWLMTQRQVDRRIREAFDETMRLAELGEKAQAQNVEEMAVQ